jgi:hypothetical protein
MKGKWHFKPLKACNLTRNLYNTNNKHIHDYKKFKNIWTHDYKILENILTHLD